MSILQLVGAGLGVTIAPACVRRIATPEMACLTIEGTSLRSQIELACFVGESRPIVTRFAQIARALSERAAL
jgi:hypothetical protein